MNMRPVLSVVKIYIYYAPYNIGSARGTALFHTERDLFVHSIRCLHGIVRSKPFQKELPAEDENGNLNTNERGGERKMQLYMLLYCYWFLLCPIIVHENKLAIRRW